MMSGMGWDPVAFDPFMPATDPIPISPYPNEPGRGWYAEDFYARRRRRDHHDPVGIVTLVGNDHASCQGHRQRQGECRTQSEQITVIHHDNHTGGRN